MRRLMIAAAALAACSFTLAGAPVSADEPEDAIVAVFDAMAHSWSGSVEEWDAAAGEVLVRDRIFTCVVTSQDGLDAACWNADGFNWVTYLGGGAFRDRAWTRSGPPSATITRVEDIERPAGGRWSLTEFFTLTGEDGVERDWRVRYAFAQEALSVVVESRETGSDAAFEQVSSGVYRQAD